MDDWNQHKKNQIMELAFCLHPECGKIFFNKGFLGKQVDLILKKEKLTSGFEFYSLILILINC